MVFAYFVGINSRQLYPHIKHVMEKFKGKLSKDDLKRFAKEVCNVYTYRFTISADLDRYLDLEKACEF